jgi:hypothetical protein
LPKNKFVKTFKKSREFRNKSREKARGEVTMYVGAVDEPDIMGDYENKEIIISTVKHSEYDFKNTSKEDSSKIVLSGKTAAVLNLSIEENLNTQWIQIND